MAGTASTITIRVRSIGWFGAGIAVAVAASALFVGLRTSALPTSGETTFVPITPCRLLDTRPETQVGTRSTPLGATDTHTVQVTGPSGNCTIPADATGVALNVTAVLPTSASFITVFPAEAQRPLASNLNVVAGAPPTPNKVDVKLSAAGKLSFFNQSGNVHLVVDATGYYTGAGIASLVAEVNADRLWAVVNADGSLARGSHVTSASKLTGNPGRYEVIFDRNVTGCAYVASPGNPGISVPPQRIAAVAARDTNENGVHVRMWSAFGAEPGSLADGSFHLIVDCPFPAV